MFQRLVIANRGEIALRIVRTCRELGIETAVIASDVDQDSAAARMADHVISLGDPWCYLDGRRIVAAAKEWGADAIHPGYGFLAENPAFARQCAAADIVFVGPSAEVMEHLGEKDRARATAQELGIPCLPGTTSAVNGAADDGDDVDVDAVAALAEEIGYPVLIKAVAGGGGRGMRLARDEAELRAQLPRAMSEAKTAFKSPAVYLEKFLSGARHVEVQVLADTHGNVVHLGERDCTVQRRHQKLIEEAPSPAVDEKLRTAMGEAATRLLAAVGYVNAGTVEFLVDGRGHFYFLEVNTRVQVEHPVTELLYGVDIIAEQIRIAAGRPLSMRQDRLTPRGWAMECRINAEDPTRGFAPKPGLIVAYEPPGGPGVRVDGAAYAGWTIPPFYDSMIAKVIVWAQDRDGATARMERALSEFVVGGVPTTIPFHLAALEHEKFRAARFDTGFADNDIATERVRFHAEALARRWAVRFDAERAAVGDGSPAAGAHAAGTEAAGARAAGSQAAESKAAGGDASGAGTLGDREDRARRVAAIAAAVAAATDRPHRLVSISPAPTARPAGHWGVAARLEQMQKRQLAIYPRRDRRM